MSAELWMPLHVGKYLLDTHELNLAQHGAYLLLLMHYWQKGSPLPDDDCKLCRIVGVSLREWKKALAPALRPFFTERDGKLHQKRADIELARAADISGKRRAAALASHHRPTTGGGGGNGVDHDANAPASAVDNSANASANASANGVSKAANAPALAPHTVPSKKNNLLTFKDSSIPARAREAEPSEAAVRAARQVAAAEIAALPDALGSAIQRLGRTLRHVEYAPGRSPSLSCDDQAKAVLGKHKPKTAYLSREQLARQPIVASKVAA